MKENIKYFLKNVLFAIVVTFLLFFIKISIYELKSGNIETNDVKVNIKTCFGNETIRKDVPLEEYLVGVLYGEENPTESMSEEYLKAFVIFARTYSLKRG